MRRALPCLGLLLVPVLIGAVHRQVTILRAASRDPGSQAALLPREEEPRTWIFVRAGCPHCRLHLLALQRALGRLPEAARRRACRRLRLAGGDAAPMPGVRSYPDSLRRALGVRIVPCTWFLRCDGHVVDRWVGARTEDAWRRALLAVADSGGAP